MTFGRAARYGGAILVVLFAIAYFVWRPLSAAGPPMGDFAAYYAGGVVWSHGGDPYGTGVWSVERVLPGVLPGREELLPYVGPPLGLPIWAALGRLPYAGALVVWGLFLAGCLALLMIVPARLAGRRLRGRDGIALLLLACASGPFVDGLSLGQAAVPAAAAISVATACAARGRWWAAAAAAFVAALFKPNLAFALATALRSVAALVALGVAAAGSLAGNALFAGGIAGSTRYLAVLRAMTEAERFYAYQFTPTAILYGFGAPHALAVALGNAVAVLAIAAVALAIAWSRAGIVDGIALGCAALPFFIPYVHEPDFLIAYLPGLLVLYRARGTTWVLGMCGVVLLAVDAFALAQGRAGLAFSLVTAAVAALELAALGGGRPRLVRLAPLGVVALILGVGLAAPAYTLPMWPAALPAHFAAPAGLSASAVWGRELAASGLVEQRPWVAFLRALTLAGSALVGIALARTAREERAVA